MTLDIYVSTEARALLVAQEHANNGAKEVTVTPSSVFGWRVEIELADNLEGGE